MKRKLICAGILCLGTLLSICLAMLTLQNLGAILSLFVDTSGDQPDFATTSWAISFPQVITCCTRIPPIWTP